MEMLFADEAANAVFTVASCSLADSSCKENQTWNHPNSQTLTSLGSDTAFQRKDCILVEKLLNLCCCLSGSRAWGLSNGLDHKTICYSL